MEYSEIPPAAYGFASPPAHSDPPTPNRLIPRSMPLPRPHQKQHKCERRPHIAQDGSAPPQFPLVTLIPKINRDNEK